MEKNYIIKLTLALYRVTELFPAKEPLKFFLREKANEILADFVCGKQKSESFENILENLEILQNYFKIAKRQNWVDEKNFLVLEREYEKISRWVKEPKESKEPKSLKERATQERIFLKEESCDNERREKILEILRKKRKAQTGEFEKFFPEVTKRTLRRDFQELLDRKLVKRIGNANRTFYKLSH